MKYYKTVLILIIVTNSFQPLYSQTNSIPVYVIVHGAWGGGWAFKNVDSLLTETGSIVYRPTLTGQGERVHLASTGIGLNTHIIDIVNTILYEDLHDVVLVGHSYGGMVVTGVADSIPDRILKLIYIDAFVPENGESILTIIGDTGGGKVEEVNGFVIPSWVPEGKTPPKDVPHPFKTWSDTIILRNTMRVKIPTTYILTVKDGVDPGDDDFASQAKIAKEKGWPVLHLEADHNAQWSAPEKFVKMLQEIVRK